MIENLLITTQPVTVEVPEVQGTLYGGGRYVGKIQVDGKIFALIVAPRALGQSSAKLAFKTTNTVTAGNFTLNDGWTNTQLIIAAGSSVHPAATFCRLLNINGYDDWYLPSVDELELCYRMLKPTTKVNSISSSTTSHPRTQTGYNPSSIPEGKAYTEYSPKQTDVLSFRTTASEAFDATSDGWYHTSSQKSDSTTWLQRFYNGEQSFGNKAIVRNVRAVRRVLLS